MIVKKEVIMRQIAGDTILVPLGTSVYESNGLYIFNEIGAFLWNLIPEADTADDLLKAVLDNYDVSQEQAKKDIDEFLSDLKQLGLI